MADIGKFTYGTEQVLDFDPRIFFFSVLSN